jgi:hypothetical protein
MFCHPERSEGPAVSDEMHPVARPCCYMLYLPVQPHLFRLLTLSPRPRERLRQKLH